MKKAFCIAALALTGTLAQAGVLTTENIRCVFTNYQQFTPTNGQPGPIEVTREELRATRHNNVNEPISEHQTTGQILDEAGQITRTYTAARRTKTEKLAPDLIKEISDVVQTITVNGESYTKSSHSEITYKLEIDGTRTTVSLVQDGKSVPLSGQEFSVKGLDGVEFDSYFNNTPETFEMPNGTLTILQSKQVCSIQK